MNFLRWFTKSYWEYLLTGGDYSGKVTTLNPKGISGFGLEKFFFCRLKGHDNMIWYNIGGLEPDTRCSHCGDYL